jgi:hypothetical protein
VEPNGERVTGAHGDMRSIVSFGKDARGYHTYISCTMLSAVSSR